MSAQLRPRSIGWHRECTPKYQPTNEPRPSATAGFAWRALRGLAAAFRVHGVDSLGTGLSGRPRFPAKSTAEAESFFVDSLEAWRAAQGPELGKMVLVGHSLGGYLAAAYALRHPEHVAHLVLVCPAGIGKKPEGWAPPTALTSALSVRGAFFRVARWAWDAGARAAA